MHRDHLSVILKEEKKIIFLVLCFIWRDWDKGENELKASILITRKRGNRTQGKRKDRQEKKRDKRRDNEIETKRGEIERDGENEKAD